MLWTAQRLLQVEQYSTWDSLPQSHPAFGSGAREGLGSTTWWGALKAQLISKNQEKIAPYPIFMLEYT
jgi:hypothetical protein